MRASLKDKTTYRIAMFGHKRIPSREGGVEIVVGELAMRMASRGHAVTVYSRSDGKKEGKKPSDYRYRGVAVRHVFTIPRRGAAALTSSVSAALRSAFGRYDIVHIHAEGPAFMSWLPKLFGKRVIVTIHGLDYRREKWGPMARRYLLMGEKSAVRFADELIVLSRDMQAYFEETYGRRTVFIPNGISRPALRPADRILRKYGLKGNDYILFLGRLVPEKGVHELIEAYRALDTDRKLVIAGGSSDTAAYERELHGLAEGDDRIIFTGFVQGALMEELMSQAAVYVLPSHLEGMPLSLLEAMSFGRCCLVSDIAECTEVVGDHAAVFHAGDVEDLKKVLGGLLADDSLRRSYADGAADYICRKYDWESVTDKTLALYKGEEPDG